MPQPMFSVNEQVWAFYFERKFAAEISSIEEHDGVQSYKVHMIGWSKYYDFHVPLGREDGILLKGPIVLPKRELSPEPQKKIAKVEKEEKETALLSTGRPQQGATVAAWGKKDTN